MAFRAGRLLLLLAGIAGCNWEGYAYRWPCDPDAPPGTCCPVSSHLVAGMDQAIFICAPDEISCGDADAGACPEGGPDAN